MSCNILETCTSNPPITIFTPTYNRKELLKNCYDSLVKQTNKSFIWQIIDDGSSDGTEQEVKKWIDEGLLQIEYYYKENGGKPSATNISLDYCHTAMWGCLDSDDYLAENAIQVILDAFNIADSQSNCVAIVSWKKILNPKQNENSKTFSFMLNNTNGFVNHRDLEYKYRIKGDKFYVYFTNRIGNFRYPIFSGEKFIGESYLHEFFSMRYEFYVIPNRVYYCEYRDDGLTAQHLLLHVRNPKGYKELKRQMMVNPKPLIFRFRAAIMYVAGCKLCGDKNVIANSPCKMLTLLMYIPGLIAFNKKYKVLMDKSNGKAQ